MNWRRVLIVSGALNVLLGVLALASGGDRATSSSHGAPSLAPPPPNPTVRVITNHVETTNTLPALAMQWPGWSQIIAADWGEFRTNLLAVGCSRETIRDILHASIQREYFAERRPHLAGVNAIFWDELARQGMKLDAGPIAKAIERIKELHQRYEQVMRAAFAGLPHGDEAESTARQEQGRADQFSHLEPALQPRASEMVANYDRKREELMTAHRDENGQITPEGKAALSQLAEAHHGELGELMGPEATLEWRLRTGGQANWASELRGFEATPEELRQIAEWRLTLAESTDDDEKFWGRYGISRPPSDANPAAGKSAPEARFREMLGDERYAEYQQAKDASYQQLYDLSERFELPEQAASQALQMQTDANRAAEQIRNNSNLTGAQRRDALRAIQQETQRSYQGLLGEDAYSTYQRHGGEWLNTLSALNPNP